MRIKYKKEGKQYVLLQSCQYINNHIPNIIVNYDKILTVNNCIKILPGFRWDGPSGFATIATENSIRGSLVHDAMYTLIKKGYYHMSFRRKADKILFEILREDGMSWLRSEAWYFAVRLFGWRHVR